MERARDILSEANRSKKDAEMLIDDIETSRNTLLGMQMGIRKQRETECSAKKASSKNDTDPRSKEPCIVTATKID